MLTKTDKAFIDGLLENGEKLGKTIDYLFYQQKRSVDMMQLLKKHEKEITRKGLKKECQNMQFVYSGRLSVIKKVLEILEIT